LRRAGGERRLQDRAAIDGKLVLLLHLIFLPDVLFAEHEV